MSTQLKKKQKVILIISLSLMVIVILIIAFIGNRTKKAEEVDKPAFKKHTLASPLSEATNEAHWIERTQNAWREESKKSSELDKSIKALASEKDKQDKVLLNQKEAMAQMQSTVMKLKEEVVRLQMAQAKAKEIQPNQNAAPNGQMLPRAVETKKNMMGMDSGFIQHSAKLTKIKKPRVKTPANYVFSNTFAKAVILQGADASAGVLSQTNPDIMMFQIIDDGVMPNHYKSHLKNCFVSASVIGDISSERGKLRTERISCIFSSGKSIDAQVTGIISDSKNGIRGRPVWRDGPMAQKAFWGNFWGSMGNIGQQYANDISTSPLGTVSSIDPSKIPLAAVSSGGSGAAKMYAQYNIKRAEMYHPIIQLPPARVVDVVFLKGFWLDGGTDSGAPETLDERANAKAETYPKDTDESAEEKAANQFFYQKHAF